MNTGETKKELSEFQEVPSTPSIVDAMMAEVHEDVHEEVDENELIGAARIDAAAKRLLRTCETVTDFFTQMTEEVPADILHSFFPNGLDFNNFYSRICQPQGYGLKLFLGTLQKYGLEKRFEATLQVPNDQWNDGHFEEVLSEVDRSLDEMAGDMADQYVTAYLEKWGEEIDRKEEYDHDRETLKMLVQRAQNELAFRKLFDSLASEHCQDASERNIRAGHSELEAHKMEPDVQKVFFQTIKHLITDPVTDPKKAKNFYEDICR